MKIPSHFTIRSDNPLISPDDVKEPDSLTDADVAASFAEALHGDWLHVSQWKTWMRWDGTRWTRDTTNQIQEAARQYAIELVDLYNRLGNGPDQVKQAARFKGVSRMKALVEIASTIPELTAEPHDFDRNPDLLTVENGTVDLRSGELRSHDPDDFITKAANANYDPTATHQDIDELLKIVDDEVRDYLQVALGYSITGHTSEALVLVFDGGGSNGKSLLIESLSATLGDHARPVAPQLIMRSKHSEHPTILADLQGLRLASIVETEEGGVLRLEQVKAITGGDQITARYMYGSPFTFTPTHQLIVATNHRPIINTIEHAAWRRLRLIRFPHTYKPADQADTEAGDRIADTRLLQRIRESTAAKSALLAWLIKGATHWNQHGIPTCTQIEHDTNAWRREEDTLGRFIEERLSIAPDKTTRAQHLYQTYKDWCQDEGRPAKNQKNFSTDLENHPEAQNIEKRRASDGVRYYGAEIKT